jgi:hypothetical protein
VDLQTFKPPRPTWTGRVFHVNWYMCCPVAFLYLSQASLVTTRSATEEISVHTQLAWIYHVKQSSMVTSLSLLLPRLTREHSHSNADRNAVPGECLGARNYKLLFCLEHSMERSLIVALSYNLARHSWGLIDVKMDKKQVTYNTIFTHRSCGRPRVIIMLETLSSMKNVGIFHPTVGSR